MLKNFQNNQVSANQSHEIQKSKIGERVREIEESKKQKRQSIEKKERVTSARWATNGVDNGLRLLESDYLCDSGLRFCFSTGLRLLESE